MTPNEKKAEAYYLAMAEKNVEAMGKLLHPDVHFLGPLANLTGKESVLEPVRLFLPAIKSLTIRAICGSGDKVMLAYDCDWGLPIGVLRVAALLTFKDDLIGKMELFFDARPFEMK